MIRPGKPAAARQQRITQAAAARRMVKEAKAADHYNTDDQRHSAFGRLLSWLRRSGPGG
jgi:thioredoxin-like negative regulator of GroEL